MEVHSGGKIKFNFQSFLKKIAISSLNYRDLKKIEGLCWIFRNLLKKAQPANSTFGRDESFPFPELRFIAKKTRANT
jgi:hypothetical protein